MTKLQLDYRQSFLTDSDGASFLDRTIHRNPQTNRSASCFDCLGASFWNYCRSQCINHGSKKQTCRETRRHPKITSASLGERPMATRRHHSMRRARKKWREIAEYLTEQKRVPISPSAVRNFFARATDPDRSRPLGFEPIPLKTDDSDPLPKSSQPIDLPPSPHSKHVLTQPKNEKQKIWS